VRAGTCACACVRACIYIYIYIHLHLHLHLYIDQSTCIYTLAGYVSFIMGHNTKLVSTV